MGKKKRKNRWFPANKEPQPQNQPVKNYPVTTYKAAKVACHSGNHLLFRLTDDGAGLYVGGWTRGAEPRASWGVIDLANGLGSDWRSLSPVTAGNQAGKRGFRRALSAANESLTGPWISLPLEDYGHPDHLSAAFWKALAEDVKDLLNNKTPVMIACTGGHGRTGTVAAILAGLLIPERAGADPVIFVRDNYCKEVVETLEQYLYVLEVLNLPIPPKLDVSSGGWRGAYGAYGGYYKSASKPDDQSNTTIPSTAEDDQELNSVKYTWDGFDVVEYEDGLSIGYDHDGKEVWVAQHDSLVPYDKLLEDGLCPICKGMGYLDALDGEQYESQLCPSCDGFGTLISDGRKVY